MSSTGAGRRSTTSKGSLSVGEYFSFLKQVEQMSLLGANKLVDAFHEAASLC